ncbi:uncharacterized protein IUM83_19961 [Phytophthora cinnamomi]|uniref:uncharacterized protein n=1 Tax=Phytophthora cinnamomi TaxID=4785 RepID=UPI00355A03D7|nr:hypothetical protein IUM83_19961 [Phytophthora cinnamomi]
MEDETANEFLCVRFNAAKIRRYSAELELDVIGLTRWKRRLRAAFGLERALGAKQTIAKWIADFGENPSKVLLPRTPETKTTEKAKKFRSSVGTPYFEDSHMLTSKKVKPSRGYYDHLYDPSDEAELGEDPREIPNKSCWLSYDGVGWLVQR